MADTHCERPDGSDLPATVLRALDGVDLVVHAVIAWAECFTSTLVWRPDASI